MVEFNYNSVLVPTDFSDQAHGAVDQALKLVREPNQLTVLHIALPLNTFPMGDPGIAWGTLCDKKRTEHLRKVFSDHFSDPKYDGIHFEVAFGSPADENTRFAQEHSFNLIMLPSHGRTGLMRMMIGSVAERVVRLVHCPVLVLRD